MPERLDAASDVQPDLADDFVRRCFWSPTARIPSSMRIATTVTRCAAACMRRGCPSTQWVLKTMTGHGKSKRRLAEPIAVCLSCGFPWDTWDEVNHMATGAPGGGVTQRGRWTRYIHVGSASRGGGSTSAEERIFGQVDVGELLALRRLAGELLRSRQLYWPMRVYFLYVLRFEGVRGRGGVRALASYAAGRSSGRHRSGEWPRAPFAWNRDRVAQLVDDGRGAWVERLVVANVLKTRGTHHTTE